MPLNQQNKGTILLPVLERLFGEGPPPGCDELTNQNRGRRITYGGKQQGRKTFHPLSTEVVKGRELGRTTRDEMRVWNMRRQKKQCRQVFGQVRL